MTDGRGDARAGRGAKTRPALGRVLAALLGFFWLDGMAQDLEPRRWSQLPTGLNVLGAGLARTDGDIFFDPVLRIDDATFDLYGLGVSYVRAFDWFGRSGRIDAVLPYATGRWEGLVDGEYTHLRRHGLADPRLRASINLYGAPAMSRAELARYAGENPVRTTIGAGLQVTLPFGEYMSRRLINLGGNRYVFQPQIGVLHQRNRWQFELTGSVFLFGDNDEFWQGTQLEQDPLWFVQGHVIYGFRPGWWVSLSGGYAYDGEASVNGVAKDNDARSGYWAASLGLPVGPRQSLKLAYVSAQTHVAAGVDTQGVAVAWSVNWGE
jgi:hypothetical protein